jgi:hypothetical protein
MGNTQFQWLRKTTDGLIFMERFNNETFFTTNKWVVTRGDPKINTTIYYEGYGSFDIGASNYPLISKGVDNGDNETMVVAYFIDEPTNTTGANVFIKTMSGPSPTNAVWEGFGVDNAISTVNFTYCKSGIKYDSGIPRDANPHRIVFIYNTAPNNSFKVYVDGTMLFSRDPAYIQNLIVLGTEATSGALPFGYFDYVQVTKGPYLTINNSDGLNNSLYDSVNSLVGTGSVINLKTYDFPLSAYSMMDKGNGSLQFFGDTEDMYAGDVWTHFKLDLGRRVSTFDTKTTVKREDKESNSGKTETLNYNTRDFVSITLPDIQEDDTTKLKEWWAYAQKMNNYSVAINTDNIGGAYVASGSGTTVVLHTVNHGIGKGATIIIKGNNNLRWNIAKVLTVAGATLTLDSTIFDLTVGDLVVIKDYYPFALTIDNALGLTLTNVKVKRWSFSHSFKENI